MTRISYGLVIGALAALVLGTIPANAQLMNEGSQVIACRAIPSLVNPDLACRMS